MTDAVKYWICKALGHRWEFVGFELWGRRSSVRECRRCRCTLWPYA